MNRPGWIHCQVGSREYYSIPRALNKFGRYPLIFTDMWYSPGNPLYYLGKKFKSRYHPAIKRNRIISFNRDFLMAEARQAVKGKKELPGRLFEKKVSEYIHSYLPKDFQCIFSYSYSSYSIFKKSKGSGNRTILGQINPGPCEAELVKEAFRDEFGSRFQPSVPEEGYWDRWRKECELSDYMVVNSSWSKKLLMKDGIPGGKIRIIPLAYERESGEETTPKIYPGDFSKERPLRLLFLGSISIRKGFHILKKVMAGLSGEPVVLDLAGPLIGPPQLLDNLPANIIYHGPANPLQRDQLYRKADVFVLPTLSDGFAITQLEARYWQLPLLVSGNCGEVAIDEVNGLVLGTQPARWKEAILKIIENPEKLYIYSKGYVAWDIFSLNRVGMELLWFEDAR